MIQLTDLQRDAFAELFNIGMGSAGAALSEMVGEEVKLVVPSLEFVSTQEAAETIATKAKGEVSAIREAFEGHFWGHALLMFPEQKSLELVRALLKEEMPLEILSEMEQEALTEVGNIILNACIASLANFVESEITCDLPGYMRGTPHEVIRAFSNKAPDENDIILLLRMDFSLSETDVDGYVIFMMEIPSVEAFRDLVDLKIMG